MTTTTNMPHLALKEMVTLIARLLRMKNVESALVKTITLDVQVLLNILSMKM